MKKILETLYMPAVPLICVLLDVGIFFWCIYMLWVIWRERGW